MAKHVPEFAANGKERITLRHLLDAHRRHPRRRRGHERRGGPDTYWDEIVAGICAIEREEGWEPGQRAGYHLGCGMTMLAEVVRRVDGRPLRAVRARGGLPPARDGRLLGRDAGRSARGVRRPDRHHAQHRRAEAPVPLDLLDTADTLAKCIPGGGGRGPMHQLARLYRALLGRGELDGVRILSPQTVEAMSARHRVGLFDETFHCECDWGLGVAVDNFAMGAPRLAARVRARRRAVVVRVRRPRTRSRRRRSRPTGCVRATTTTAVWTRR